MQNLYSRIIFPPLLHGMDENRAARHLKFVFRFTQTVIAITIALNLLLAPNLPRILAMSVVFFGTWLLYGLVNRGKTQLACWLFLSISTLVIFGVIYFSGGLISPAMNILILFSLLAGVLLGGWGGIGFTAMSLVAGIILLILEKSGRVEHMIHYAPVDYLIVFSIVIINSMILLFSVFSNLRIALNKATLEGDERFQAETERKKTEEKLLNIERRYAALFETHTDGIFFIGLDGTILESNQRAARMLGYALTEILGQNVNRFIAPDERTNLSSRIDALRRGEKVPLYERNFICRDGHPLPTEVNAMMVYDKDGNPQGIQSIVRDISERKRNENALHTLIHQLENQRAKIETALEVSKATISILDPDILSQKIVDLVKERFGYYYVGLFLLSEDKARAILRTGTGVEGKKLLNAKHSLAVGEGSMIGWCVANKAPRIALDVGLDAVHFDNPMLPETRSEMALPLLVRGEAIGALTVQSSIEAAFSQEDIAVLQVVTDLVAIAIQNARFHTQLSGHAEELEHRVSERTAQLEATNRELEAFSYSVSHDLRTPLRAINGYSSILLEEFSEEFSPAARNFQEKIRHNAIRMGELVDGLLAFSRLGRKKIQKSEVNLTLLVNELLEELAPEISSRHILVRRADLPPCEADPLLIKQVFTNLLNNAIKFTRNQPAPQIEIGFQDTDRGQAYFVRDNGAGFDMQYVDRLFGVFQRLHRDDEFEGTGVGLAIIQRIIHRHGGDVWAQAELDKGATFFFTLSGMAVDESHIYF